MTKSCPKAVYFKISSGFHTAMYDLLRTQTFFPAEKLISAEDQFRVMSRIVVITPGGNHPSEQPFSCTFTNES